MFLDSDASAELVFEMPPDNSLGKVLNYDGSEEPRGRAS